MLFWPFGDGTLQIFGLGQVTFYSSLLLTARRIYLDNLNHTFSTLVAHFGLLLFTPAKMIHIFAVSLLHTFKFTNILQTCTLHLTENIYTQCTSKR